MSERRILILTNRVPYPLYDGGNLAMNAMINGYKHAGWEVHLLSMNTTRHPVSKAQLNVIYKDIDGFDTVDVDNHVKPVSAIANLLFSRQPNHAVRFFQAAYKNRLENIIKLIKPDAIQVESIFLATYLPYIKKLTDAILVLRLHNIEYQVWRRLANETPGKLKKFYLNNLASRMRRFEEDAWRRFDLLLPITKIDAGVVKDAGVKTEMVVAPFGIDFGKIKQSGVPEEWNGYHMGAMDWLPNADAINWFLTGIWPAIHKELPDFKFYFAGRGMLEVFKKIKVTGVYCMGEVPDAEAFIADKKILIVPLRSGGGIRVKILEGMAAGKLVISTNIGMQGIDAVPGTHYLAANDQDEFISAIKWALTHKEEAEKIAKNAIVLMKEKYDQDIIMQHINVAIIQKISTHNKGVSV